MQEHVRNFVVLMAVCRLSRLAVPLVLQNLFGYSLAVIAAAFVGHLNDAVLLSSAVLANSFYNVTGLSVVVGLSAGMETLCGQVGGMQWWQRFSMTHCRNLGVARFITMNIMYRCIYGYLAASRYLQNTFVHQEGAELHRAT